MTPVQGNYTQNTADLVEIMSIYKEEVNEAPTDMEVQQGLLSQAVANLISEMTRAIDKKWAEKTPSDEEMKDVRARLATISDLGRIELAKLKSEEAYNQADSITDGIFDLMQILGFVEENDEGFAFAQGYDALDTAYVEALSQMTELSDLIPSSEKQ